MKKPLIIGITASPRSALRHESIESILNFTSDELELKALLQEMGHFKKRISNSDGALISAFFGAKHFDCNFLLFNLRDIFDLSKKNLNKFSRNKELLIENIKKADGILISTPVYFGDCSSYVYELFNLINEKDEEYYNIFNNKTVGILSSGAKRNGGQETTNIFTLFEFFSLGANIIGNGPPTSQYGGTIWAGDKGSMAEDSLGIETAIGTGKKMGEILNILNPYNKKPNKKNTDNNHLNLALILPGEKSLSEKIKQEINNFIEKIFNSTFEKKRISLEISYIDIEKENENIKRCLGCNECPPTKNNLYCIIDDKIRNIRDALLNSDSILFVNYLRGTKDIDTWINFKVFFERTRHLRHNNFELTNKPAGIITVSDENYMPENNLSNVKFITYFLRHNTICVGPPAFAFLSGPPDSPSISEKSNERFYNSAKTMLSNLFKLSHMIKSASDENPKSALYIPYGFGKFKNHQ
jgi:multimeric flavodoxin WrbA